MKTQVKAICTEDDSKLDSASRPRPTTRRPQSAAARTFYKDGLSSSPQSSSIGAEMQTFEAKRVRPRPPLANGNLARSRRPQTAVSRRDKLRAQYSSQTAPKVPKKVTLSRVLHEEIESQYIATGHAIRELQRLQLLSKQKKKELQNLSNDLGSLQLQVSTAKQVWEESNTTMSKRELNDPKVHLRAELQRQEEYKKTLKHMLDRQNHQVRALKAQIALLRSNIQATEREKRVVEERVSVEQNNVAELKRNYEKLHQRQEDQRRHAELTLNSLRKEIQSREEVRKKRSIADCQRRDMLQVVQTRPMLTSKESKQILASIPDRKMMHITLPMKEGVKNRADSVQGRRSSVVSTSSRRESISISLQEREDMFKRYELDFAQIVKESGEQDVENFVATFIGYSDSIQQLHDMQVEMDAKIAQTERKWYASQDLASRWKLAEGVDSNRTKRVRDYLEWQQQDSSLERENAREVYLSSLKSISLIREGMENIIAILEGVGGNEAVDKPYLKANEVRSDEHALDYNNMNRLVTKATALAQHCRSTISVNYDVVSLNDIQNEKNRDTGAMVAEMSIVSKMKALVLPIQHDRKAVPIKRSDTSLDLDALEAQRLSIKRREREIISKGVSGNQLKSRNS